MYDPSKLQDALSTGSSNDAVSSSEGRSQKEPQTNYREKYKHLISTEISEPAPVKSEPERQFGFGEH